MSVVTPASAAPPTVARVDAAMRAEGNRRALAEQIGRALFTTVWPAQLLKVRVDGVGTHDVAGLVLSGQKFHRALDAAAFTEEAIALIARTFAASNVEEVDLWAIVPLTVAPHAVVAGDFAQPTSAIVYGVTVRRAEGLTFPARLRAGENVYWNAAWRASLGKQASNGARRQGVPRA